MNLPRTPQAGNVPQARSAGAALLDAAARGGAKILEVAARDHVREQQGLIDDAVLRAQSSFSQWRDEYGRTHQGRDALGAQRDYADAFGKISEDTLAHFDGSDSEVFRRELQRRLAVQGLYAVRDGGQYQRQQDERWKASQLEGQLAQFRRTVADHPDDMDRVSMEMETLRQSWLSKNPGMDDGAFRLKLEGIRDTERMDALIASGNLDEAERLLGGPDVTGGAGGAFRGRLPADMKALADSAAREAGVDPALVAAVMRTESGGRQDAVSGAGARGVMQLMPDTAKALGVDPDDAADNARGGAKYLGQMLERYGGNREHALMAYNWGPGNVDAWLKTGKGLNGQDVPAETRKYVSAVTGQLGRGEGGSSSGALTGLGAADRARYGNAVRAERERARAQAEKAQAQEAAQFGIRLFQSYGNDAKSVREEIGKIKDPAMQGKTLQSYLTQQGLHERLQQQAEIRQKASAYDDGISLTDAILKDASLTNEQKNARLAEIQAGIFDAKTRDAVSKYQDFVINGVEAPVNDRIFADAQSYAAQPGVTPDMVTVRFSGLLPPSALQKVRKSADDQQWKQEEQLLKDEALSTLKNDFGYNDAEAQSVYRIILSQLNGTVGYEERCRKMRAVAVKIAVDKRRWFTGKEIPAASLPRYRERGYQFSGVVEIPETVRPMLDEALSAQGKELTDENRKALYQKYLKQQVK